MKGYNPNKLITNNKNNSTQLELGSKNNCENDCKCDKCSK